MASIAFVVKVGERTFTLDKFTMGDWRMLKTHFGLNSSDIVSEYMPEGGTKPVAVINFDDPNVLVGVLVVALHHERPDAAISALIAEVDALDVDGLEFPDAEEDAEDEDPTPAESDTGASAQSAKTGNGGKRPKTTGKKS